MTLEIFSKEFQDLVLKIVKSGCDFRLTENRSLEGCFSVSNDGSDEMEISLYYNCSYPLFVLAHEYEHKKSFLENKKGWLKRSKNLTTSKGLMNFLEEEYRCDLAALEYTQKFYNKKTREEIIADCNLLSIVYSVAGHRSIDVDLFQEHIGLNSVRCSVGFKRIERKTLYTAIEAYEYGKEFNNELVDLKRAIIKALHKSL